MMMKTMLGSDSGESDSSSIMRMCKSFHLRLKQLLRLVLSHLPRLGGGGRNDDGASLPQPPPCTEAQQSETLNTDIFIDDPHRQRRYAARCAARRRKKLRNRTYSKETLRQAIERGVILTPRSKAWRQKRPSWWSSAIPTQKPTRIRTNTPSARREARRRIVKIMSKAVGVPFKQLWRLVLAHLPPLAGGGRNDDDAPLSQPPPSTSPQDTATFNIDILIHGKSFTAYDRASLMPEQRITATCIESIIRACTKEIKGCRVIEATCFQKFELLRSQNGSPVQLDAAQHGSIFDGIQCDDDDALLIIPICSACHWQLLLLHSPCSDSPRAFLFDSSVESSEKSKNYAEVESFVSHLLTKRPENAATFTELTLVQAELPVQPNLFDCGLFAIVTSFIIGNKIAENRDEVFSIDMDDQKFYRDLHTLRKLFTDVFDSVLREAQVVTVFANMEEGKASRSSSNEVGGGLREAHIDNKCMNSTISFEVELRSKLYQWFEIRKSKEVTNDDPDGVVEQNTNEPCSLRVNKRKTEQEIHAANCARHDADTSANERLMDDVSVARPADAASRKIKKLKKDAERRLKNRVEAENGNEAAQQKKIHHARKEAERDLKNREAADNGDEAAQHKIIHHARKKAERDLKNREAADNGDEAAQHKIIHHARKKAERDLKNRESADNGDVAAQQKIIHRARKEAERRSSIHEAEQSMKKAAKHPSRPKKRIDEVKKQDAYRENLLDPAHLYSMYECNSSVYVRNSSRLASLQELAKRYPARRSDLEVAIEDTKNDITRFGHVTEEQNQTNFVFFKEYMDEFHLKVCASCGIRNPLDDGYQKIKLDESINFSFPWLRFTNGDLECSRQRADLMSKRRRKTSKFTDDAAGTLNGGEDNVEENDSTHELEEDIYNAQKMYEERQARSFEVVVRGKGGYRVAIANAAMFQNCFQWMGQWYHLIPEAVFMETDDTPVDAAPLLTNQSAPATPSFYMCSSCCKCHNKPFDMAPVPSIAHGEDLGKLNVTVREKITHEALSLSLRELSDLEKLLLSTIRSYQIIAKLVARSNGGRRAKLSGHVISFEQKPVTNLSSFGGRYDKHCVEAALRHISIYVVGTEKGKTGTLERRALNLLDLRLRPDVIFNFHQVLTHVPDYDDVDPVRQSVRASEPMTWAEFKELHVPLFGADVLQVPSTDDARPTGETNMMNNIDECDGDKSGGCKEDEKKATSDTLWNLSTLQTSIVHIEDTTTEDSYVPSDVANVRVAARSEAAQVAAGVVVDEAENGQEAAGVVVEKVENGAIVDVTHFGVNRAPGQTMMGVLACIKKAIVLARTDDTDSGKRKLRPNNNKANEVDAESIHLLRSKEATNDYCDGSNDNKANEVDAESIHLLRSKEATNDYCDGSTIIYGGWSHLFPRRRGLRLNYTVPKRTYQHLCLYFDNRFAVDQRFIFRAANELRRHDANRGITSTVNSSHFDVFVKHVNDSEYIATLERALKDPHSKEAVKVVERTMRFVELGSRMVRAFIKDRKRKKSRIYSFYLGALHHGRTQARNNEAPRGPS